MNTRSLTKADAAGVAELWLLGAAESAAIDPAFKPRISRAAYATSLESELNSEAVFGWGAFNKQQELLGYVTARIAEASSEFEQGPYVYVLDLDVRAESRRQGIAGLLVGLARRYAAMLGLASIEASWLTADPRASSFWAAQGFAPYLARARAQVSSVTSARMRPNPSIERTSSGKLRLPPAAAHVKR